MRTHSGHVTVRELGGNEPPVVCLVKLPIAEARLPSAAAVAPVPLPVVVAKAREVHEVPEHAAPEVRGPAGPVVREPDVPVRRAPAVNEPSDRPGADHVGLVGTGEEARRFARIEAIFTGTEAAPAPRAPSARRRC